MLEKACMAVEEAAKGGGVYPEVLFEVAHQWFWLYEQTAGGSSTAREGATSCSANGIRAAGETGRGLPEGRGGPGTEPVTVAAAAVTAAATVVPVISVGSSLYPGPGLGHGHSPGLHPYTALQPHLPCSPQYLTHPAHPAHPMPHMPRPAVFPVPSSAYPQVRPVFYWGVGNMGEQFTGGWSGVLWANRTVQESWERWWESGVPSPTKKCRNTVMGRTGKATSYYNSVSSFFSSFCF